MIYLKQYLFNTKKIIAANQKKLNNIQYSFLSKLNLNCRSNAEHSISPKCHLFIQGFFDYIISTEKTLNQTHQKHF